MKTIVTQLCIITIFIITGCNPEPDYKKVGYAPAEAFEEGSKYPYYGSFTKTGFIETEFTEKKLELYKRRGQHQILNIVAGKPEVAAAYCQTLLSENPDDPEFWYTLSIAQCQLSSIDDALQSMENALSNGLPFERYLAGPRDLLAPLSQTKEFKEIAGRYEIQLLHGPLLGSLSATSARFWVRTVNRSSVQVLVSTNKDLNQAISSKMNYSDPEADYTTVVTIQGLKPSTRYYYDVLIDEKSTLATEYPQFLTYPNRKEKSRFQIGFGGGAGYVPQNERVWDTIRGHNPIAVFLLGDNIYHDMPEAIHGGHYYTYYRRQSRPEFRRLTSSSAIYSIWDDHDCATNDVFMGPYKDKPEWKMDLFHLFRQNWNNPSYGDSDWPGVWFDFSIGDVDFFMLDGRFYRTNPHAPNPTMLGPIQKAWLLDQLKASSATFKVIASPVPWSFASKGESLDTWNGFREERKEIFDFLANNKIEGVLLISADRHRSDAWRIERPNSYALYEFESSRLTNQHVHKVMPGSLFGYNEKQSFGLLTFDTTRPDPTVTYQIYSIDDEHIYSLDVKLSEISHSQLTTKDAKSTKPFYVIPAQAGIQ
jgi:alkaline phosphatase D